MASPEHPSFGERAGKWVEENGVYAGLGMMAFGLIYSPLLLPGAVAIGGTYAYRYYKDKGPEMRAQMSSKVESWKDRFQRGVEHIIYKRPPQTT